MLAVLWVEVLKVRRSRLSWVSLLAFALGTTVMGLIMFAVQDPERARSLGLLATKAQLTQGTADWPAYLALLAQTIAVGGLVLFGILTIWVFGREFSDRTVKDLLALPTPRGAIVGAKFLVTALWCALLTLETFGLGLIIGFLLGLPGWSAATVLHGLGRLLLTAVMAWLLVTSFALAASIGRGYLAAVGTLFVTVFLAQIIAVLGYGHLFPWAVPGIYSGIGGPDQPPVGIAGYTAVVLVGVASIAATLAWWRNADQSQ
ncbi:ABC transporter permease [Amycolatopsis anabasis]|uniref:ABC transporter permease n=1 Tax=Amycolatopsis anabasis TaxID=1840409 RepID=UPI00131C9A5E|nr:ABC transporter permease [Amycolatopsis anabasis]